MRSACWVLLADIAPGPPLVRNNAVFYGAVAAGLIVLVLVIRRLFRRR
jgi:hypothetical protein